MKRERNLAVAFLRNGKALLRKLQSAVRHGSEAEIINASIAIAREFGWCVCVVCFWTCLIAGFWRPQCFLLALLYRVLVSVIGEGRKAGAVMQAEDAE